MKRTLLGLVLMIGFSTNASESHGQGYFESYVRGNFEKAWEELQNELSARPVRQITYRQLDSRIKIAGDVYEQTRTISFANYHDLLKQMLSQDSKRSLLFDLPTFVEYGEEIHSKKLSDESLWNLEIDRVSALGRSVYDRDRRAKLFALDTFFSRKWYDERTNVADDQRNLRWLFFAGKAQFMISPLNGQFLSDYVVHCEAQSGRHCDFTEEARSMIELSPELRAEAKPEADVAADAQRRAEIKPLLPEMVVIPAGRFRMGCVSGWDCEDDEQPVHEVTVASFALSN